MLPYRSHWHFAPQRDPLREARLLWFAEATDRDPGDDFVMKPDMSVVRRKDDTPEPEQKPRTSEMTERDLLAELVEQNREQARAATQRAPEQAAPTPNNNGATAESPENRVNFAQMKQAYETMSQQIRFIQDQWMREDVQEMFKKLTKEEQQQIHDARHFIDIHKEQLELLGEAAMNFDNWKSGQLQPASLRLFMERFFHDDNVEKQRKLAAFDVVVRDDDHAEKVTRWNEGSLEQQSDKLAISQAIWDAIDGQGIEERMQSVTELWVQRLKDMEDVMKEAQKSADEAVQKKEQQEGSKNDEEKKSLWDQINQWRQQGFLGMEFYSPLEIYRAVKRVGTAFVEAREDYINKRANKFAATLGDAFAKARVPFGDVVQRRLTSTLESEFSKEKNEFKDQLGDDDFQTLRTKFEDVKNNPPQAIAVLEAAAGHGWLYEIADLTEDDTGSFVVMGKNLSDIVPPHWDQTQIKNYASTLTRSNTAGGKEERQKGYDRLKEQTDPAVFKKRFEAALESTNYWSAIGIAEVFIDRGKTPEVSEYITLTMLEHVRTNPNARKYMAKPVLEQFGIMNNKWGTATFAQTNIVYHVNDVFNLKKNPDNMKGSFLSVVERLQNDVYEISGKTLSRKEVIAKAAEILAGRTISINGEDLSIFHDRYRDYWDESKNLMFSSFDAKQALSTAADYYQMDGSLLLLPQASLVGIFKTGSTGTFDSPEFARNYVGQFLYRLQELEGKNSTAALIFKKEIGGRLKQAMKQAFTGQAPKQLGKYDWKRGTEEGKPLIASLIKAGVMTKEEVFSYARGHQGAAEFEAEINQQLRNL